jgi:hypothetical protein
VLSATDISNAVSVTIRPSTQAVHLTGATWTEASKTITLVGAFAGYTPTADDQVEVRSGTGFPYGATAGAVAFSGYSNTKVVSKTSDDAIVVEDGGLCDDGETDLEVVLFKRLAFGKANVNSGTTTFDASTTTINVSTSLGFTPQVGDFYYVYDLGGGLDEPAPDSTPEDVPTLSADTTLFCPWPFFALNWADEASYSGYEGSAIYPASADNTEMHMAWWGTFTTPPDTFVYGDTLVYQAVGDFTYTNTPFMFEVLVIPNFDPEDDWTKNFDQPNATRLDGKVLFFQSPTVTFTGTHTVSIRVEIRASGLNVTGVPNTYGYAAGCEFLIGASSGVPADPAVMREYIGPYSRSISKNQLDFSSEIVRWQVLIKTEHPSRRGSPGFHGHYASEPFSCTTGNGGTLLRHTGNQTNTAFPRSPRTRWSHWSVDHLPGGTY